MKIENYSGKNELREIDSQKERMEAKEFIDFRGKNLENIDFSKFSPEVLKTCQFDTKTIWPEKLPNGFNPEKILEEGKNPGLGIRELHKEGVTGKGVGVAIVDQELLLNHEEYKENIEHYDRGESTQDRSMHGVAVASLLVGKKCGIAPDSRLHYFAIPQGGDSDPKERAIKKIIEYNKNLSEGKKIRVVSISFGLIGNLSNDPERQTKIIEKINEAEKEGVIIIFPGFARKSNGFSFMGTGNPSENKNDPEGYTEWLYLKENNERMSIDSKDREILVPSDDRTMASCTGDHEYQYEGKGGMSWSTPYLAGVFALALQVNPELTKKEIFEKIKQTSVKNKNGLKIINPKGLIELIKSEKKNEK